MLQKKLTIKILVFLIFSDILETFTQFCFKKSAFSEAAYLPDFFRSAFSSPYLWIGLFSVLLTFIIWSTILSKIDLSVAVPVASFSYILVPLVSIILLHEKITILRWSGIIFIIFGIIFVSLSSKEGEADS
ncbi:MAG: EamA family transporter [Candidatus Omnitrophota bacterium]